MGYEIVMCVMALFVNLLVVGCFALVYGTKMKYENGMLFGYSYDQKKHRRIRK